MSATTDQILTISDAPLVRDGFTSSGLTRFRETVMDYTASLHSKAVTFGDIDKASDSAREVTHDHVRHAAVAIATASWRKQKSAIQIIGNLAEYACAILVGIGGRSLKETWGIWMFGASLTVGATLLIIRLLNEQRS